MRTYYHWLDKVVGLVFILAAVPKALDLSAFALQIRYYSVIWDPALRRLAAGGSVFVETAIGVALLAGLRFRGWVYYVTFGTLAVFTGLVLYGWIFHALEDCGCFGAVLPMGPGLTTVKNVVLMVLTVAAWRGYRNHTAGGVLAGFEGHRAFRLTVAAIACVAVLASAALGDNDRFFHPKGDLKQPFAQFKFEWEGQPWDLGQGEYVVVMLSASCEDCRAMVEVLNDLMLLVHPTPLVGLVNDLSEEIEDFRGMTDPQFPTHVIDSETFWDFIEYSPPHFYVVKDGVSQRSFEETEPDLETLLDFVLDSPKTPPA